MARRPHIEVTRQSFAKRLSDSIAGAAFGAVLFIAAFPLLWWNEGRAIAEYRALKEGAGAVISAVADRIDSANDGKLLHVVARVDAAPAIDDTALGVSVDALALRRVVEMYQWKESRETREKKTIGGASETVTEYRYSTEWNDDAIDSSEFHRSVSHANPVQWPLKSERFDAQSMAVGQFGLSLAVRAVIGDWRDLNAEDALRYPDAVGRFRRISDGRFYLGADPERPEVGDVRVRFEFQPEETFSIVARQNGRELDTYVASNGRSVLLVESGAVPASDMFVSAQRRNTAVTWILRAVGALAMWLGLSLVFAPISRVLDILPMLGTIGSWGIGLVTGLIALVLSMITMGVGWLFYRPLLGGALIAMAVSLFLWSRQRATAKSPAVVTGPPPPPPPGTPL